MPLPFDQVHQWMFQHAPLGYQFRRQSLFADLRVSKPERLLYIGEPGFVNLRQRGFFARAVLPF